MKLFSVFFLITVAISVIIMASVTEAGKKGGDTIIIGGGGGHKGCHCDDHEDDHGYGGWW